jgi:NADH-quinone oxidoreductase subunit J
MTIGNAILATLIVVLGAAGMYLMLPHRHETARPRREYAAGAISSSLAVLLFLGFTTPPGPVLATMFFYLFSIAALSGGLLTVTSRNPVHSALWFASVVLATAGLFLLAGAPFLAAGTVIVYAGAIIVTFLFVIMLAQLEGKAPYDRAARTPGAATFSCFLLLWALIYSVSALQRQPTGVAHQAQGELAAEKSLHRGRDLSQAFHLPETSPYGTILARTLPPPLLIRDSNGADKPNVAGLGESLYTVHLVTVALAGVLLFVALVGAVAIANPARPQEPSPR